MDPDLVSLEDADPDRISSCWIWSGYESFKMWIRPPLNHTKSEAQRPFQPLKAQRKISKAQCNYRNKLFDTVEVQRNSASAVARANKMRGH